MARDDSPDQTHRRMRRTAYAKLEYDVRGIHVWPTKTRNTNRCLRSDFDSSDDVRLHYALWTPGCGVESYCIILPRQYTHVVVHDLSIARVTRQSFAGSRVETADCGDHNVHCCDVSAGNTSRKRIAAGGRPGVGGNRHCHLRSSARTSLASQRP